MGMGFAPTWLLQVSPLLHMTTLTTAFDDLEWPKRPDARVARRQKSNFPAADRRTCCMLAPFDRQQIRYSRKMCGIGVPSAPKFWDRYEWRYRLIHTATKFGRVVWETGEFLWSETWPPRKVGSRLLSLERPENEHLWGLLKIFTGRPIQRNFSQTGCLSWQPTKSVKALNQYTKDRMAKANHRQKAVRKVGWLTGV